MDLGYLTLAGEAGGAGVIVKAVFAAIGGVIGLFIGGVDGFVTALWAFMAADYVTGVLAAAREKKLSSGIGFWGIMRKVCMLVMVGIGNLLDVHVIGAGAAVRTAVIFFYLSNEGLSIIENTGRLGVPFPDKLKDVILSLRSKSSDGGDDNGGGKTDKGE